MTILEMKQIAPKANPAFIVSVVNWINALANSYGVNTQKRLSAFVAQAAHETDGFKTLEEYASGSAYEGRKDLGNVIAGDGKRFKGRGIFQTTGRTNYARASQKIFGNETTLLNNPELLLKPEYAVKAAFIFWNDKGLNELADAGNFKEITRKINGGYNGLESRQNYFDKALAFIKGNPGATSMTVVFFIVAFTLFYFLTNKNSINV